VAPQPQARLREGRTQDMSDSGARPPPDRAPAPTRWRADRTRPGAPAAVRGRSRPPCRARRRAAVPPPPHASPAPPAPGPRPGRYQRVGITLNNLAEVYRAQGRWEDAGRFYPQAIAIIEKNLGPDHPTVAGLLENYAVVLRRARRDAEALEIDLRARDIRAGHVTQNPRRQQAAHVLTGCSRGPRCEATPDAAGRREGSRCEAAPRCAS
jgi:tetratricopeptide (TPR) repeat protein